MFINLLTQTILVRLELGSLAVMQNQRKLRFLFSCNDSFQKWIYLFAWV